MHITYTRDQLLQLYNPCTPAAATVVSCVRRFGLWAVCRLHRLCRRTRITRLPCAGSLALDYVFLSRCRERRSGRIQPSSPLPRLPSTPSYVHSDRHSVSHGRNLVFGCLNIRSLSNKLDDLLEMCTDHGIDVVFLVETWHDTDSVCLRRLRVDGYPVVDHPRPRLRANTLSTNHGALLL